MTAQQYWYRWPLRCSPAQSLSCPSPFSARGSPCVLPGTHFPALCSALSLRAPLPSIPLLNSTHLRPLVRVTSPTALCSDILGCTGLLTNRAQLVLWVRFYLLGSLLTHSSTIKTQRERKRSLYLTNWVNALQGKVSFRRARTSFQTNETFKLIFNCRK